MLEEKIEKVKEFHRFFQCLVILLANKRSGIEITPDFKPQGIFKYEGGASVAGREIVIKYNEWKEDIHCYDDWNTEKGASQAEVTEEVVRYLLNEFSWTDDKTIQEEVVNKVVPELGISINDFIKISSGFISKGFLGGDPLRSLFQS